MRTDAVEKCTGYLPRIVDAVSTCPPRTSLWGHRIEHSEVAVDEHKAVFPLGVVPVTHDRTRIVYAISHRVCRAKLNLVEAAANVRESELTRTGLVKAHDLCLVVDAVGFCRSCTGYADLSKSPARVQKPMHPGTIVAGKRADY